MLMEQSHCISNHTIWRLRIIGLLDFCPPSSTPHITQHFGKQFSLCPQVGGREGTYWVVNIQANDRSALSIGPNWIGTSPLFHLSRETVSEMLHSVQNTATLDEVQKPSNPVCNVCQYRQRDYYIIYTELIRNLNSEFNVTIYT